jgi:hypothetical protein
MSVPSASPSRRQPDTQKAIIDQDQLVVSPRRARHMLDCGNTRLYELLKQKELESYLDGRSRKITVESIYRLIARRLVLTRAISNVAPTCRGRSPRPATVTSST